MPPAKPMNRLPADSFLNQEDSSEDEFDH